MKRTITTIILAFGVTWAWAQNINANKYLATDSVDFSIQGITDNKVDSVVLWQTQPSANGMIKFPTSNGNFYIKGRLPQGVFVQIGDGLGNDVNVIIDAEPITVNMLEGEIKGSAMNNRLNEYQHKQWLLGKQVYSIKKSVSRDDWRKILYSATGDMNADEIPQFTNQIAIVKETIAGQERIHKAVIEENKDNIIPVFCLANNFPEYSYEQLKEMLSPECAYYLHPALDMARNYLDGLSKRQPGRDYIDFASKDSLGTTHRLSDYVGKGSYVLIDFWASWCGPCVKIIPEVKTLHEKYESKGLKVIGVSLDKNRDAWVKAIKKYELPWLNLSELKYWECEAVVVYGLISIPETILISPEGKIIANGFVDVKVKLENLFEDKK